MTIDLPHTYTDDNGAELRVSASSTITIWPSGVNDGDPFAGVWAPTGGDAVALALAVLAAAGDTGYAVLSRRAVEHEEKTAAESAAESMRGRVVDEALELLRVHGVDRDAVVNDIARLRALPLLSDDGDTYEVTSGLERAHVRTYPAPAGHYGDPQTAADFDSGWAAGAAHVRAEHENRISELELQFKDISTLLHGHTSDIGNMQAAIRGITSGRTAPRRYGAGEDG